MIKALKMIFGNIKKNLFQNNIMIIFVGISVFLMNISLSRFAHQEYINNLVRDYGLYDNYLYSAPPNKRAYWTSGNGEGSEESEGAVNLREAARRYIIDVLDNMKSNNEIEDYFSIASFNGSITDSTNDRADFVIYPHDLAIDLKFPLLRGKNFSQWDYSEGVTPIIVGNDFILKFKVGDRLRLNYVKGECVVIGVLEKNRCF